MNSGIYTFGFDLHFWITIFVSHALEARIKLTTFSHVQMSYQYAKVIQIVQLELHFP